MIPLDTLTEMRKHIIFLQSTTIEQRQALKALLEELGEPIFPNSDFYQTCNSVAIRFFDDGRTLEWCTTSLAPTISYSLFMEKYTPFSPSQSETNQPKPQPKETNLKKLDLIALLEMMAKSAEPTTNATNAQHIAVLTESDGEYVGYVYADTIEELEDIVRKPANEGRQLHVFNYNTTLTQKPRKVIAIERS